MKEKNYDMQVRFWGVRGSVPTPGKDFIKYGGNTACIEVRCGETILIFDAGTGMRMLGRQLIREFGERPVNLHILISHTHWDHIQGFPFLELAYRKNNRIMLYGGHTVSTLEKLILSQMDREYFPVALFELAASVEFIAMAENEFYINDVKVYFTYLLHPALSLGFRIEYMGKVLVYATDNEILDTANAENDGYNVSNVGNLIKNADILIADSQYTEQEYLGKVGWGHSSIERIVHLANQFGVKRLYAFHYDPLHTDRHIDSMLIRAKKIARKPLKVFGSREGKSVFI